MNAYHPQSLCYKCSCEVQVRARLVNVINHDAAHFADLAAHAFDCVRLRIIAEKVHPRLAAAYQQRETQEYYGAAGKSKRRQLRKQQQGSPLPAYKLQTSWTYLKHAAPAACG